MKASTLIEQLLDFPGDFDVAIRGGRGVGELPVRFAGMGADGKFGICVAVPKAPWPVHWCTGTRHGWPALACGEDSRVGAGLNTHDRASVNCPGCRVKLDATGWTPTAPEPGAPADGWTPGTDKPAVSFSVRGVTVDVAKVSANDSAAEQIARGLSGGWQKGEPADKSKACRTRYDGRVGSASHQGGGVWCWIVERSSDVCGWDSWPEGAEWWLAYPERVTATATSGRTIRRGESKTVGSKYLDGNREDAHLRAALDADYEEMAREAAKALRLERGLDRLDASNLRWEVWARKLSGLAKASPEAVRAKVSSLVSDPAGGIDLNEYTRVVMLLGEYREVARDIANVKGGTDAIVLAELVVETEQMAREANAAGRLERQRDEARMALAESRRHVDVLVKERDTMRDLANTRRIEVLRLKGLLDSAEEHLDAWRKRAIGLLGYGTFARWGGDDAGLWRRLLQKFAGDSTTPVRALLALAMGIEPGQSLVAALNRFEKMAEEARHAIEHGDKVHAAGVEEGIAQARAVVEGYGDSLLREQARWSSEEAAARARGPACPKCGGDGGTIVSIPGDMPTVGPCRACTPAKNLTVDP